MAMAVIYAIIDTKLLASSLLGMQAKLSKEEDVIVSISRVAFIKSLVFQASVNVPPRLHCVHVHWPRDLCISGHALYQARSDLKNQLASF